ncbi:hypothetical protein FFF34_015720 [Inquilinus sp. KBS0705]|nr:hypothetical protein FFF34_015720 [Inquilinus sp. KBS0705]
MKNQVTRTILLLVIAGILFTIGQLYATPANAKWMDFMRGAAAGFGLAGCISFLILLAKQFAKK